MEKLILKAKHWQVFIFLFIDLFLINFKVEGSPLTTALLRITGFSIVYGWMWFLGNALTIYKPIKLHVNKNLFLFNGFAVIATYAIVMIFSGGEDVHVSGVIAIPFFYLFYALIHLHTYPAKLLKAIERDTEVNWKDYIGIFFLFVFWIIGIWFIQPRINKIVEENDKNDNT